MTKFAMLDRHGLQPRDDVIVSDLAFSRERSAAGGNPESFMRIYKQLIIRMY